MDHTKKDYEAPQLTVVEFRTECGYANSTPAKYQLGLSSGRGQKSLEDRTDGGNWGNSDGWF